MHEVAEAKVGSFGALAFHHQHNVIRGLVFAVIQFLELLVDLGDVFLHLALLLGIGQLTLIDIVEAAAVEIGSLFEVLGCESLFVAFDVLVGQHHFELLVECCALHFFGGHAVTEEFEGVGEALYARILDLLAEVIHLVGYGEDQHVDGGGGLDGIVVDIGFQSAENDFVAAGNEGNFAFAGNLGALAVNRYLFNGRFRGNWIAGFGECDGEQGQGGQ